MQAVKVATWSEAAARCRHRGALLADGSVTP